MELGAQQLKGWAIAAGPSELASSSQPPALADAHVAQEAGEEHRRPLRPGFPSTNTYQALPAPGPAPSAGVRRRGVLLHPQKPLNVLVSLGCLLGPSLCPPPPLERGMGT